MRPGNTPALDPRLVLLALGLGLSQVAADCEADDDDSSGDDFCITVAGGGGFDSLQAAIDAAPDGGVITVCSGEIAEDIDITKPITISGTEAGGSMLLGGGAGTMIEIDQVTGPVVLSRLSLFSPNDNLGTIRGIRITESNDVTLNEVQIEFEPESNGDSRGLVGVEASQSSVVANELDTFNIGFSSDTGGKGIFAQTNSVLEVLNSTISGSGSFGIHVLESQLTVDNTVVSATNRPPTAENIDSDGTAIFIEGSGNEEIVVQNSTLQNGSFVGIWMQANNLTVTNTTIDTFAYGIFMQGDAGSASGRDLVVSGVTFTGLANWSVLANANTTLTSSFIDNTGSPAVSVRSPGGDIVITGNTIQGVSEQGILGGGNSTDGRAATVEVVGNTISDVTGGNGVLITDAVDVVLRDNIVSGIDHAYHRDVDNPGNNGQIVNGYGIACFRAESCSYAGNDIDDVEFANIVIVQAGFDIGDDFIHGAWWNGIHIEQSQGTITGTELRDNRGSAVYLSESTVVAEGVVIADTTRGPIYTDLDGEPAADGTADPVREEAVRSFNGWGVESRSGGLPAYLEWRDGTITNSAYGGLYSFRGQIIVDGNTFTNSGITDEENTFSQGAMTISQGPEDMDDPIIEVTNNAFYGSMGSNLVQLLTTPGVLVRNNVLCGGQSGGLWISNADAAVRNNRFGTDEAGDPACDDLAWNYAVRMSGNDLDLIGDGSSIENNIIVEPNSQYGVRISGLGDYAVEGNSIEGGSIAGLEAAFSIPSALFSDRDGDGQSPWSGDCHDDDASIGGNATEIPDDLIDNDCDATTPDSTEPDLDDNDMDGFSVADGDCDDTDPTRSPGRVEVIGNWIDDDCDGWADTDAEDLPVPNVTLLENTITGAGTGVYAQGAVVHLSEADGNPVGNSISGTTGAGIDLRSWSSQGAVAPGVVNVAPSTTLSDIGGPCVRTSSADTVAILNGGTLTGCDSGFTLNAGGTVTATNTVIEDALNQGVSAINGAVVLDGVLISNPGTAGIHTAGIADVQGTGVNIVAAAGPALQILGGNLDLVGGGIESTGIETVLQTQGTATLDGVDIVGATGVHVQGGSMTLIDGTIADATVEGIHGDAGTLTVDGTSVTGAAGAAIRLDSGVTASIVDAVLTDSGGWGVDCDGVVTLNTCTATASGNLLGDFQQIAGCDVATNAVCGPPIP